MGPTNGAEAQTSLHIQMLASQPRCPSIDEWIKKLWYIYTMDIHIHITCTLHIHIHIHIQYTYYSAIKRNAFESVLMRWMNLEPIIQNEASQKEKDK